MDRSKRIPAVNWNARGILRTLIGLLACFLAISCKKEKASAPPEFSYNAFLQATLELAGVNIRLRMPTDSALALLPSSIQKLFDEENNSYRISAAGNSLGILFIANGRVKAIRRFSKGRKPADFFALYEEVKAKGEGVCFSDASKWSSEAKDTEYTFFDFNSKCRLYTFTLRSVKGIDSWTAFVDLAIPDSTQ